MRVSTGSSLKQSIHKKRYHEQFNVLRPDWAFTGYPWLPRTRDALISRCGMKGHRSNNGFDVLRSRQGCGWHRLDETIDNKNKVKKKTEFPPTISPLINVSLPNPDPLVRQFCYPSAAQWWKRKGHNPHHWFSKLPSGQVLNTWKIFS